MSKVRCIMHIDTNSAYLSWSNAYGLSKGKKLDLREVPSVVGGNPKIRRGIILAASIPAKNMGIKTGSTIYLAKQKCPNLIIIPPNYALYVKYSNAMVDILKEYSPIVERCSIDECFIDYTGMELCCGEPITAANTIKNRIQKELGFTVNIGISTNKLLAKMASNLEKPNKIHTLYPAEIESKMWPLPINLLFGVGSAYSRHLKKLNINTIGDLANYNYEYIKFKFKSHGVMLWNYANGINNSKVKPNNEIQAKGLGNSTTTIKDIINKEDAYMVLLSLTETVGLRLRDMKKYCSLVAVNIKNGDFFNYSHQKKLLSPIDSTNDIYEVVKEIFNQMWKGEAIRHLGVRIGELSPNEYQQRTFFDNTNQEKNKKLDKAIDNIRLKFGSNSLIRATFINSNVKPLSGGTMDNADYPMMSSLL